MKGATMEEDSTKALGNVIRIDDERIQDHLKHVVRGSVEETLNALLDAEADGLVGAARYERSEARQDTRAGSYDRKLQTTVASFTSLHLEPECHRFGNPL
jgi:transposase-like protein